MGHDASCGWARKFACYMWKATDGNSSTQDTSTLCLAFVAQPQSARTQAILSYLILSYLILAIGFVCLTYF